MKELDMVASEHLKSFVSAALFLLIVACTAAGLAGCTPRQALVLGPWPEIPFADPADYRHIKINASELALDDEAPVPFWRPVGVRRTGEGLAVDFLIEAETSEGATLIARFFSYCFRHRHDGSDWVEFRGPGGEVFHLEPGCVSTVRRIPPAMRISPTFAWWIRDESADGERYLTTTLFHTAQRYEPDTIEVRFNVVPQFSRMAPWRPECNVSEESTSDDGPVSDSDAWMCFTVRDVRPWVMPR